MPPRRRIDPQPPVLSSSAQLFHIAHLVAPKVPPTKPLELERCASRRRTDKVAVIPLTGLYSGVQKWSDVNDRGSSLAVVARRSVNIR
jgi:hypothetical protein